MAVFRDNEIRERNFEQAKRFLIPHKGTIEEQRKALQVLNELVSELGPVVDGYPVWHPFMVRQNTMGPLYVPNYHCGYEALNHTIFFAHGFVTCPHDGAEKVISSVETVSKHIKRGAHLTANRIDAPLYSNDTDTIVVKCVWDEPLDSEKFIPKQTAIGLMLEHVIPNWYHSGGVPSWEKAREQGYFLGEPHGARSSLFINHETIMAMKRIWISLIESDVFGPVYYE